MPPSTPLDRSAPRAGADAVPVATDLVSETPAVTLDAGLDDALRDPLTGLANRQLFQDRVDMTVLRSARHRDRHFAVMSVSLEQLHGIETSFGHDAACDVLREFATRLRTVVRNYDSIARLGSDEFGILLESIRDESDAARVADRVHQVLRLPIQARLDEFMVSANVGIVLSLSGIDSAARLTQLAGVARERARYTAAPYEIFDPVMHQHAQTRLQKEMDLRRALEANEFELHYQPIVSLATGRPAQMEALVRWRHPQRGLLSAAEFIGVAEDAALAVPLGWLTLGRAAAQLREWRDVIPGSDGLEMSVNVTPAHFRQSTVTEQLRATLGSAGVTRGINLEITERMLIDNPRETIAVLNHIRSLGVGIHLDDFGTGYSSLQYLHELPLDAIKIDRAFIARMRNGGRDVQVVATIRELARQLGVPVVAEGVETPEHLALVRELGCEYAQGYHFSMPASAAETADLLRSNVRW